MAGLLLTVCWLQRSLLPIRTWSKSVKSTKQFESRAGPGTTRGSFYTAPWITSNTPCLKGKVQKVRKGPDVLIDAPSFVFVFIYIVIVALFVHWINLCIWLVWRARHYISWTAMARLVQSRLIPRNSDSSWLLSSGNTKKCSISSVTPTWWANPSLHTYRKRDILR